MSIFTDSELKSLFDEKVTLYKRVAFIDDDPIQIPHMFSRKKDIEIMGFLTAILSWGQRKTIISKCKQLAQKLGSSPYEYVMNGDHDTIDFVHRTFNSEDLAFALRGLKHIYKNHGGLEAVLSIEGSLVERISHLRSRILEVPHHERSEKHIANPTAGSAAKRINMFLRWMVRKDEVDFGLWTGIHPSELMIPLDVHSGSVSRAFGLLDRKQNDWKSVVLLTDRLKKWSEDDPIQYDFALFGMGVNE